MVWRKELIGYLNKTWFRVAGKRPWRRGYGEYRRDEIIRVLAEGRFDAAVLPPAYGFRLDERIVEYPWFLSRLPSGSGNLLDAGSVLNHEFLLKQPTMRSKRVFISTLAPEALSHHDLGVSYVYEDLRESCFQSEYFDWIASLSTVEHIGMDNTLLYTSDTSKREHDPAAHLTAISEFRRMLKSNGRLYLTMPFGTRKDHGWFQIFDSGMVDRVLETFDPKAWTEHVYMYTTNGWINASRDAAKDGTYFDIRERKDYDADFAAASRAIVCLDLVKR